MVSDDRPKAEHEIAADLRLRPEGPPVTRLSRKVLVGVASLAIVAVLGGSSGRSTAVATGRRQGPSFTIPSTRARPMSSPSSRATTRGCRRVFRRSVRRCRGILDARCFRGGGRKEAPIRSQRVAQRPRQRARAGCSPHQRGQSNNAGVTGDDAERNI
jgi:hypothetical protein